MITLAEAKEQLQIPASDTSVDAELRGWVDALEAIVERFSQQAMTKRQFVDRHLIRQESSYLKLDRRPVVSLTTVERVDTTDTWAVTDLDVDGDAGRIRVIDGPTLLGLVKVTYQAGYTTIPAHFKDAAKIILQHLWSTQRVRGPQAVLDDSLSNTVGAGRGYLIPNQAAALMGEPQNIWVG